MQWRKRVYARIAGLLCLVASIGALPGVAFATNGMYLIGYGPKAQAVGGASIAFPQDALAGAVNPAAIGVIGNRFDIAGNLFLPTARATLGTGSTRIHESSAANLFFIPAMGMAISAGKLSVGFSMVGVGGGGSRYNRNLYNAQTNTNVKKTMGVSLFTAQINPTVAYHVTPNNVIGASVILSVQQFRAFGMGYFSNFTSTGLFTTHLTNNGNDWAYGAGLRIGWLGRFFNDRLSLGLTGSTKVFMTRFTKYKDLFAGHGRFDTPPIIGVGIAYKVTPKLTAALDVTRTFYTQVAAVSNPGPFPGKLFPVSQAVNALGRDQGLGFGWRNQTVFKLGAAYRYDDQWTLRAGWNYGKSPIPEETGAVLFNIVAPATVQNHLTLGLSYRPSPAMEINMSYVHAFKHTPFGPTFIGYQGQIAMYQNSFGGELELRF